ncbi:MAG: nitroreductase [Halieaceae bacterium]|jgi:nitroreductase|nr:nitroreductase [Halieaceae bacterium]
MTTTMSVTEAVQARRSVRAFTDQPVSREMVEEILTLAGNAPSGSNIQPWKVCALSGAEKERFSQAVFAKAATSPAGDPPDVRMYPEGMGEPWRERRAVCGEIMYEALGIGREDKTARMIQGGKNLTFFDAPVGLVITMDRSLAELQILDMGIFVQTIMLLAQERGLATCPQAAWSMWSDTFREAFDVSDNEMVMMGISLGFPNNDEVAANIVQPRLPLQEYASLHGF